MRLLNELRRNSLWVTLLISLLTGALLFGFWWQAFPMPPAILPDVTQKQFDAALPPVNPPHTVGQQFVATHPNLSAVELLLVVYNESESVPNPSLPITFHLHRDDVDGPPVTVAAKDTTQLAHNQIWRITFPPQRESAGQTYYFWLEGNPESQVSLWYSPLDFYWGGEHHSDHQAVDGDLTFSTYYTYDTAVLWHELDGILQYYGLSTLFIILALLLPGWVLATWLIPDHKLDGLERLALASVLSLALFPLLFLWATVFHGRLERAWLVVIYSLCSLAVLLWAARRVQSRSRAFLIRIPAPETIVGLFFLILILGLRLVQIRELLAPPGIDAPHHALITTLVSDFGRVPTSFRPMLPIDNSRYHFGFHTMAAAMHWLTGDSLANTILVLGQVINAAISLGIYFFTFRLTGQRIVALLSLIFTGLVSPFPAFYLTWGRYTAMAGLLLLTATLGVTIMLLKRPTYRLWVAGALLWSGLLLTHYNMLALAICFLLVYAICSTWLKRQAAIPVSPPLLWLIGLIGLSLLLSIPWLYHLGQSLGIERLTMLASLPSNEGTPYFGMLSQPPFPWLIILGGLGTLHGLRRQQHWIVILWLWLLVGGVVANLHIFGMLRVFFLNNAVYTLIVFVPMVILSAYALISSYQQLRQLVAMRPQSRMAKVMINLSLGITISILLMRSAWQQASLLDQTHGTVTEADMVAMEWIREQTPENAVFLTNAWYQPGQMTVGPDAGVWIPILTGRQATLPPITFGQGSAAYRSEVLDMVQAVQAATSSGSIDEASLHQMMVARGVTHVYLGANPGLVTPAMLWQSPYYHLAFSNGPVSIFEFRPSQSVTQDNSQHSK